MSPEERSSYENGIWLCRTHAKEIDDDENRFTRELLLAWRSTAERLAGEEQGRPLALPPDEQRLLVPHLVDLGPSEVELRWAIPAFLRDIGATRAWAPHVEGVRMLLYEIALNAITHGSATRAEIEARDSVIYLRDDGTDFGVAELRADGTGGSRALVDLEQAASGSLTVRFRRTEEGNEWSIVDELLLRPVDAPCSIVIDDPRDLSTAFAAPERWARCSEVHIYPDANLSYSHWFRFIGLITSARDELAMKTIVVHRVPAQSAIGDLLRERLPRVRLPD